MYDITMQISNSPNIKLSSPPQSAPPSQAPGQPEPPAEKSTIVRDVVAVGAGAVAGVAGGIYGLGEGLIKGAVTNYPKHVSTGIDVGRKVLTPVGGATGALVAVGLTGAAAVGIPLLTALNSTAGFIGGTLVSGVENAAENISTGAKRGADFLSQKGEALGQVGAVVGKYVGGALGGVAGAVASFVKGVPDGWSAAKQEFVVGKEQLAGLPNFAKETFNAAYTGGREFAGSVGAATGGTIGVFSGTGATLVDGMANSVQRGAQWADSTASYIRGENRE